jgi:hypothetical protein
VNYARRQQYRRLSNAGTAAAAAAATGLLALAAASAGWLWLAGAVAVAAAALGVYTRHWLRLAGRSRIGAESEDEVRRALARLQAEGWRVRHSLPWQGRGDIDSLVLAPTGVGGRDRDEDQGVRPWSSRQGAGASGVAVSLQTSMVPQRRAADAVCRPTPPHATRAGRRARRVDRSTHIGAPRCHRDRPTAARPVRVSVAFGSHGRPFIAEWPLLGSPDLSICPSLDREIASMGKRSCAGPRREQSGSRQRRCARR